MAKSRLSKPESDDPAESVVGKLETQLINLQAKAFRLIIGRDNIQSELNQTVSMINECQQAIKLESDKETSHVNDTPNE